MVGRSVAASHLDDDDDARDDDDDDDDVRARDAPSPTNGTDSVRVCRARVHVRARAHRRRRERAISRAERARVRDGREHDAGDAEFRSLGRGGGGDVRRRLASATNGARWMRSRIDVDVIGATRTWLYASS